ncbi:MAG: hypothetical protein V5A60_04945 [Haloarculaceae archaeon]|jgi:hypothetical protein
MTLRTAIRQSWYVTAFVLVVVAWVVLKAGDVFGAVETLWTAPEGGAALGQVAASGVVGLAVMAVFLGLLVVLYGELGEASPAPSAWPPEE